jgi:tRNA-specific 2-thiouridylase
MSGGVDSSVAAHLLKQQGHDLIGLFMRTGVHGGEEDHPTHKKGCCSALDAGDARRVADRLDIPFHALDFENDFRRIMDYFADDYLAGRTPNPCVVCNNWLKFGKLWSYGKQLDADYIATGHYVRVATRDGDAGLYRAVDPTKDQSYVLFGVRRVLLPRLLFPLGGYHKHEVRAIARDLGLPVADKPDSVEICFVPDNDHAKFVKQHRPDASTPGNIVDTAGTVLAQHDGIERFTIGQRKGLGFGSASRRYVLDIVPASNTVVIGDKEELLSSVLFAERVNWLIAPPEQPLRCQAKIRYRADPADAWVEPTGDAARVRFDTPQSAITPGQAVVFYLGERVLGGGWIVRTQA